MLEGNHGVVQYEYIRPAPAQPTFPYPSCYGIRALFLWSSLRWRGGIFKGVSRQQNTKMFLSILEQMLRIYEGKRSMVLNGVSYKQPLIPPFLFPLMIMGESLLNVWEFRLLVSCLP
jgi:hypothetical protein